MQINNAGFLNPIVQDIDLTQLKVGQQLEVEILSTDADQEGIISLGGKPMRAKIEAQVQTGDRFWAAIKEAGANGIVLSRDINASSLNSLSKEQIITLIDRGVGFDPRIAEVLTSFVTSETTPALFSMLNSNNPQIRSLMSVLLSALPDWSKLNSQNYTQIIKYFSALGLENEKSVYDAFFSNKKDIDFNPQSVKANILKITQDQSDKLSKEERAAIGDILKEITGQQLWAQSGTRKNAYSLLHLLLQDQGEYFNCKIALESSRKGKRMDPEHCHIALQVDTPNLGKVGADIMLYENKVNVCLLHEDIEVLRPVIQELRQDSNANIQMTRLQIEKITLKSFQELPYFQKFLSGKQQSGVDVKG
ncbi:MAG: hypothetical protein AWM53_00345 [Candidatus Dichloromethanomonas elyunquensis]|nr:MAG: hypothetical protein AWM53_00345 [Candidatus Dichloromethanomonas elyunquensis]